MAISQEWWDRWWDEDYSWDGLAEKDWEGWVVPEDGVPVPGKEGVDGRQATLQDYWRRAGLAEDVERPEFQCPQTGRRFTRVHLPLAFQDGSQTLKGTGNPAFRSRLNAVLQAELAKPIVETEFDLFGNINSPDHRLQWQGAVLLDFSLGLLSTQARCEDYRFPVSLQAMNAAFLGITWFARTAFSGNANFASAAFSEFAWFAGTAFSGNANFASAAFSGNANFASAAFSGGANFNSAAFSGFAFFADATFSAGAAFSGDAHFASATFSGDAHFAGAAFSGNANFASAAFSGGARFDRAAFSGDASFDSAAFSGDARFDRAAFSGNASFDSAAFLSRADFSGEGRSLTSERVDQSIALSSQSGDKGVALEGHLKGEPAPLSIARRSVQRFITQGAVFLGQADFSNRDIWNGPSTDQSDFHGAHFFHLFKLHGSVLHRGINFGNTRVELAVERGKTKPSCLPLPEALKAGLEILKKAVPGKPKQPEEDASEEEKERYALDAQKWSALYEGDLEDFQEWRRSKARAFAEGPVEDRIEYFRALEDCYRTLKLFNEDRRDRPEEGRFHRLELIARRRRRRPKYTPLQMLAFWQEKEGIPIWERVLSHIYGGASNYGNSVVLPIVWLIFGVLVFAAIYAAMASLPHHTLTVGEIENALSFSAGRVLPFGPWADPEACSRIGQMLETPGRENCPGGAIPYGTWAPFGLRLLASFQSLSAIILVFLSGLAVRRRFQIN